MSVLYLFSGTPSLESHGRRFVAASGGRQARIALLMVPDFEPHEKQCREALRRAGASQIETVAPGANLRLTGPQLETLGNATGLFMAGGPASTYQRIYAKRPVARLIRERYAAGVPYAGLSAGSMMAAALCDVGHSIVKTRGNGYLLAAEEHAGAGGVDLKAGLGLVNDCVVQPHLSEWGQLPELLEDVRLGRTRVGLGLDNSICVELRDGRDAVVWGRGRLYVVRPGSKGPRNARLEVETHEPGARFDLATGKPIRA